MDLLPAATIIAVLIFLTAGMIFASVKRWIEPRHKVPGGIIVALCFMMLMVGALLSIAHITASMAGFLMSCSLVFGIIVAVFGIYILVSGMVPVPDVESPTRRGFIKVWPQVIVRRKTTKAIVDHARAIMKMNLPLAEGFSLAGQQTPGRAGFVMTSMASFLLQGLKLSEAYGRYRARSSLVLSMMQVGERCGKLPDVLQYLQEYLDRQRTQRRQWAPVWWPYAVLVTSVYLLTTTFVMVLIVPKFEEIFRDYGVQLPVATKLFISAARQIPVYWAVWGSAAVLVGVAVIMWILPRRCPRPRFYRRFADRLVWMIPGWRSSCEFTGLSHASAVLGMALGSGMTMSEAFACIADLDVNTVLRRRFERMHRMIVRGETVEQAGRKVHLPERFLWALRNGQDGQTLQSSLQLIERYYGLVASHWLLALRTILWPATVVAMGGFVGLFALAFFLPLVTLANAASGW